MSISENQYRSRMPVPGISQVLDQSSLLGHTWQTTDFTNRLLLLLFHNNGLGAAAAAIETLDLKNTERKVWKGRGESQCRESLVATV